MHTEDVVPDGILRQRSGHRNPHAHVVGLRKVHVSVPALTWKCIPHPRHVLHVLDAGVARRSRLLVCEVHLFIVNPCSKRVFGLFLSVLPHLLSPPRLLECLSRQHDLLLQLEEGTDQFPVVVHVVLRAVPHPRVHDHDALEPHLHHMLKNVDRLLRAFPALHIFLVFQLPGAAHPDVRVFVQRARHHIPHLNVCLPHVLVRPRKRKHLHPQAHPRQRVVSCFDHSVDLCELLVPQHIPRPRVPSVTGLAPGEARHELAHHHRRQLHVRFEPLQEPGWRRQVFPAARVHRPLPVWPTAQSHKVPVFLDEPEPALQALKKSRG